MVHSDMLPFPQESESKNLRTLYIFHPFLAPHHPSPLISIFLVQSTEASAAKDSQHILNSEFVLNSSLPRVHVLSSSRRGTEVIDTPGRPHLSFYQLDLCVMAAPSCKGGRKFTFPSF